MLFENSEGGGPRIASCCTGSLRSRRAFLVVETMLTGVWRWVVLRLSRFVACVSVTKGRAREESVQGA
jgi:hypothetical protein